MRYAHSITLNNGTRIKNRLFKSAMSEQLGDRFRNPTEKLARLYNTWARGGIGISVTGNVMVDRTALGEPRNVVLDDRSDLDRFRVWAEAGSRDDTRIWMQLNHPGKQSPAFLSPEPVAPSAVPLKGGMRKAFNTPRALSGRDIRNIIGLFAQSAGLAKETGFTGVQIHAAHGYLVSQFLSALHNLREDEWGGSLENRMRFAMEIYRAVRREVGEDFSVGIKLNVSDFLEGGFTPEEATTVALALQEQGIDLVEISGGSYEKPKMMGTRDGSEKEGYFTDYAAAMKQALSVPLVLTGGFRSGRFIDKTLASGAADMIGLARPLALSPDFPRRLIEDSSNAITLPRLTTGIRAVDVMTALPLTWYEYHLYTLGCGKPANPSVSEWRSVLLSLWRMGRHGFSQRRAGK